MAKTQSSLPPSLSPLAVRRQAAAEFVGVGVSKFDEMVKDGRMPSPRHIDGVVQWDVPRLREAHAALPEGNEANRWDEALGEGK